jgi:hypothetical protein
MFSGVDFSVVGFADQLLQIASTGIGPSGKHAKASRTFWLTDRAQQLYGLLSTAGEDSRAFAVEEAVSDACAPCDTRRLSLSASEDRSVEMTELSSLGGPPARSSLLTDGGLLHCHSCTLKACVASFQSRRNAYPNRVGSRRVRLCGCDGHSLALCVPCWNGKVQVAANGFTPSRHPIFRRSAARLQR